MNTTVYGGHAQGLLLHNFKKSIAPYSLEVRGGAALLIHRIRIQEQTMAQATILTVALEAMPTVLAQGVGALRAKVTRMTWVMTISCGGINSEVTYSTISSACLTKYEAHSYSSLSSFAYSFSLLPFFHLPPLQFCLIS